MVDVLVVFRLGVVGGSSALRFDEEEGMLTGDAIAGATGMETCSSALRFEGEYVSTSVDVVAEVGMSVAARKGPKAESTRGTGLARSLRRWSSSMYD